MKTYPYTHVTAVAIDHLSILRKSLFLLFATLIAYSVFAEGGGPNSAPNNPANNAEFSLPLVLKSFNASLNNKKVSLNWVTGHEKDLSHFVVERSTNGVDYAEAAIVFASSTSTVVQNYSFPEMLNTSFTGVVYYRLKLMDSRRRFQYSPVRIVRLDQTAASLQVQAYPNPVVNELRVTVPAAWQNKQVSYEVYNMNGNLVKRITTANASQTETLNVKQLGAGTYVVKAYTQNEVSSQRIVKR